MMIKEGQAKKLTIYVDENDKIRGKPVYEVIIDLFYKEKIAGVSVFRGVAGYGGDGIFHTSKLLELSTSLPIKIEAIDSSVSIDNIMPKISELVKKGLIEVSDTFVVKSSSA